MSRHMGIRPDAPIPWQKADNTDATTACEEYKTYVVYSIQLQESYHSRSSQNRFWLYGAGILGLGVMAASGGLAAASAATAGTLGLLSISGAFAASSFAVIDNSVLADIYTVAAGKMNTALEESQKDLPATNRYNDQEACRTALNGLRAQTLVAVNELEESRTNNAKAAMVRAIAEQKKLKELAEQYIAASQDPTVITRRASITAVKDASGNDLPTQITASTVVRLTVANFEREKVKGPLKVRLGSVELAVAGTERVLTESETDWFVKFTAPAKKPGLGEAYDPVLLAGDTGQRVENKSGVKIKYPPAQITDVSPTTSVQPGADVMVKVSNLDLTPVAATDIKVHVVAPGQQPVTITAKTADTVTFKAPARPAAGAGDYDVELLVGPDLKVVSPASPGPKKQLKYQ